jgi:Flp pilus assembly pilin Flp
MALYLQATVVSYVSTLLEKLHSDQRGQDTLEWVMLGGLIAAGIVGVTVLFSDALDLMITNVGYCIDFASGTPCNPGF